jgi:hypothetical protein
MDVHSNCEGGVITKTIGCQTAQGLFKITLREEVAKMNELTGTIACLPGFRQEWQTRAWWKLGRYRGVALRRVGLPPDGGAIVQGPHEGLHNQTNVLEDSMAVVEHKDNDKAYAVSKPIRHTKTAQLSFFHNDNKVDIAQADNP